MATKDHALQLLSQGLQPSVVAATLGVQDSYISQLMSDEDFAAQVEAARVKTSEEDCSYDKKLDKAEEVFLERIEEKSRIANLQQSMQAFKILNSAKRRRDRGVVQNVQNAGTIVNITMPTILAPRFVTNSQNEIVEVEGQTMIGATPKGLESLIAARKPNAAVEALAEQRKQDQNTRALELLEAPRAQKQRKQPSDIFNLDML